MIRYQKWTVTFLFAMGTASIMRQAIKATVPYGPFNLLVFKCDFFHVSHNNDT